jgi:hypothetical protein
MLHWHHREVVVLLHQEVLEFYNRLFQDQLHVRHHLPPLHRYIVVPRRQLQSVRLEKLYLDALKHLLDGKLKDVQ